MYQKIPLSKIIMRRIEAGHGTERAKR